MQNEDDTEVTFDAVDYFESQYAEGLKVVKITCTSQLNELIEPSVISDFLMEIGACSVSVEDVKGKAQVTQPQPTPPLHKGARPTRPTAEVVFPVSTRGHPLYGQGGSFRSDDKFQKRQKQFSLQ